MNVILFGATGMVGQAALLECLDDPGVERVLAVGRQATGREHPKLRDLVHADFTDYGAVEDQLRGYDACLFCLGVSSLGMKEAEYTRITYDFTLTAAQTLARLNPGMAFLYVSGEGTDSTEQGRSWWARIKGRTENDLLKLPLAATMLRPGYIHPMRGVRARHGLTRAAYVLGAPLFPVIRRLAPRHTTTSVQVAKAMLHIARHGHPKRILTTDDINAIG